MNVIYSPKSKKDMAKIWSYTFKNWSKDQADFYIRGIESLCDNLSSGKLLGFSVNNFPDFKKKRFMSHFVYYRPLDSGIFVIRILGERQDVNNHLSSS